MGKLHFRHALLREGWAEDVLIEADAAGDITGIRSGAPRGEGEPCEGMAIPGLPNLHSHAFQRGMAGLAERRGGIDGDSFWTWREVMYGFLGRLDPDDVEAVTRQAYVEMLEAGFTAVGEFHYLHHAPDGTPYEDRAEMLSRVAAAARDAGIGLTLLPVFYAQGGFGGQPLTERQRRFVCDPALFAELVASARRYAAFLPDARIGVAPHSLRAVTPQGLAEILPLAEGGPVHIHAAEQVREVEECLDALGARPVEWLLGNAGVGPSWCLVHATHMLASEVEALARSGAVAGLCPVTEANLGDGLFEAALYASVGGRFGVGSDSNVRIDAAEELRTLEYGQRLRDQARNVLGRRNASTGRRLFETAAAGGAQALGRRIGALAEGMRADIVALDAEHPALAAKRGDLLLDGWVFAGGRECVRDVWAHGRHVVREGRHSDRDVVRHGFARTLEKLLA
jgi:formimidoylglutamate deiminase